MASIFGWWLLKWYQRREIVEGMLEMWDVSCLVRPEKTQTCLYQQWQPKCVEAQSSYTCYTLWKIQTCDPALEWEKERLHRSNVVWISEIQFLKKRAVIETHRASNHMREIKPSEAVSVEETETKSFQEQICCKGLGKQTQIFTASERTFPLTLVCVKKTTQPNCNDLCNSRPIRFHIDYYISLYVYSLMCVSNLYMMYYWK